MEFEGKVFKILPLTQGTSARGPWQRQDVVFDVPDGNFSRKICATFFNKPEETAQLHEGADYAVSVNIESREYNGKWYTDVRVWRLQPKQASTATAASSPMAVDMPPLGEVAQSAPTEVDDLPF